MLKWIKISKNDKPQFGKKYLLAKAKQNIFDKEEVFFGCLHSIEVKKTGER